MKKVLRIIKNNTCGFIIGVILTIFISVSAATTLSSTSVYYDNTNSGGTSTNVSGAIDELYNLSKKRKNIITGYTYDQTAGTSNFCVTGDESTCLETTCYEKTTAGSCPAGTIIDYMVNDKKVVRFHVMYDNGTTMTMQSQKNTVYSVAWDNNNINTNGPVTVLPLLESKTSDWDNVNVQTYTMGTTSLSNKGKYTGCSEYNSCTTNVYTLVQKQE